MDHSFHHQNHSVGVEEELMVLDAETLELAPESRSLIDETEVGEVKPELHETTLEIATEPCADVDEAAGQLRTLRAEARERAACHDLVVASAGTHPTAHWEEQRITPKRRYRDLIDELRFVGRQEIIFGMHVHVGVSGADTAVKVANGLRVHLPLLLALSASSPFWRGEDTGLDSARQPIFRQFPRVGMPPFWHSYEDWAARMRFMVDAGVMPDHTWLWHDVRLHPGFGTVELRIFDALTDVDHTVALAALTQALVRDLAEGDPVEDVPWERLDENKWLAARRGLSAELMDLPSADRIPARDLARRVLDRVRPHAEDLGAADALSGIEDMLERGNGATRQRKAYEANHDLREVIAELLV